MGALEVVLVSLGCSIEHRQLDRLHPLVKPVHEHGPAWVRGEFLYEGHLIDERVVLVLREGCYLTHLPFSDLLGWPAESAG